MGGFHGLGRHIAGKLCEWERRAYMSADERARHDLAKEKEREKKEKAYREGYKHAFGVYPEETWDFFGRSR